MEKLQVITCFKMVIGENCVRRNSSSAAASQDCYQSVTMDSFKLNSRVTSKESDTKVSNMKETEKANTRKLKRRDEEIETRIKKKRKRFKK